MNRQDAEKIITESLKPIFGFALKRCKNREDAEDVSQEIALRAFRALLLREDIASTDKFIWTVAHNVLCNYYRATAKITVGVPFDEVAELIADPDSEFEDDDTAEAIRRLQNEIAYLSGLQRKIVIAYYFENRRQAEIAKDLGIPLGTVKWHLFEAKKELKRGMDTMRKTSELKFRPIKFHSYGINGSVGTKSPDEFLRSTLSQNICYAVRDSAKTVNEIAEDLGVSPVYVESEAEFLEQYCLLREEKGKYLVNFIISEPTAELLVMQNEMYRRAAELFALDLYDALMNCGILDDRRILGGYMHPTSTKERPIRDKNFLLWTLIPYIAALSGEKLMDDRISFEEVATIRPDGGHNIFHAAVLPDDMRLPEDYVTMENWCGPMWNGDGKRIFWQIDSQWSQRERPGSRYSEDARRCLSLFAHEQSCHILSKEDYAWLSEKGYIKFEGDYGKNFTVVWRVPVLQDDSIQKQLLAIGEQIKERHKATFDALKAPYVEAVLRSVPAHLRKVKEYELQFVFYSDGWFLLHCITALLKCGKLKEPAEEQRKTLTTLILPA